MKRFLSLFSKQKHASPLPFPPAKPDQPVWVIGDVHGKIELLNRLLEQIEDINERKELRNAQVVCVGDFIDRGDDSARVLETVWGLDRSSDDFHVIQGNHETMMLGFLNAPHKYAPTWLRHGGIQTLGSFGVGGVSESMSGEALDAASAALRAALPHGLEAWLNACATHWASGNLHVVHAGADPYIPMDQQAAKTLLWGHRDFAKTARIDGQWIAHGHTPTDQPGSDGFGRISTDTGAYYTGTLTAALITPDGEVTLSQT